MNDQAAKLRDQMGNQSNIRTGARKIAVTSGKGGTGKSNTSVNLSIALAKLGQRVMLVDADTNLANVDILLGVSSKYTLHDVAKGGIPLSEVVFTGPAGIQVLPGTSGIVELVGNDGMIRNEITTSLAVYERDLDIMVIDTGAGINETVVHFVTAADEAIIVTQPEPTALADAYALIKIISSRSVRTRLYILVNGVRRPSDGFDVFEQLQLVVQNFLNIQIHFLGNIPYDTNVINAVNRQQPYLLMAPKTEASIAISSIARKLLKHPPVAPDGKKETLFGRLMRGSKP
ncbi:MAG: MinD/ParA family protein [bacterium]|nr:MinD/ParA family protein [bacterium]